MKCEMIEMVEGTIFRCADYYYSCGDYCGLLVKMVATIESKYRNDTDPEPVIVETLSVRTQLNCKDNQQTTICQQDEKDGLATAVFNGYGDAIKDACFRHLQKFDYKPSKVVLHTGKNLNTHGRNIVDEFADAGYNLIRQMDIPGTNGQYVSFVFQYKGDEQESIA